MAPESTSITSFSLLGITEAIVGLITPLILPRTEIDPIRVAPVDPAEKTASAFFSFSKVNAPKIDEFLCVLIAFAGSSSIDMTCG